MLLAEIDRTQLYSLVPFVVYLMGVFVIAVVSARYLKGRQFESEYYVGSRSFGPLGPGHVMGGHDGQWRFVPGISVAGLYLWLVDGTLGQWFVR